MNRLHSERTVLDCDIDIGDDENSPRVEFSIRSQDSYAFVSFTYDDYLSMDPLQLIRACIHETKLRGLEIYEEDIATVLAFRLTDAFKDDVQDLKTTWRPRVIIYKDIWKREKVLRSTYGDLDLSLTTYVSTKSKNYLTNVAGEFPKIKSRYREKDQREARSNIDFQYNDEELISWELDLKTSDKRRKAKYKEPSSSDQDSDIYCRFEAWD